MLKARVKRQDCAGLVLFILPLRFMVLVNVYKYEKPSRNTRSVLVDVSTYELVNCIQILYYTHSN